MDRDIRTIKGNWPRNHQTHWKVFDPYEARAVENLIGTIADLVRDGSKDDALAALGNLAERFDTTKGDART